MIALAISELVMAGAGEDVMLILRIVLSLAPPAYIALIVGVNVPDFVAAPLMMPVAVSMLRPVGNPVALYPAGGFCAVML